MENTDDKYYHPFNFLIAQCHEQGVRVSVRIRVSPFQISKLRDSAYIDLCDAIIKLTKLLSAIRDVMRRS